MLRRLCILFCLTGAAACSGATPVLPEASSAAVDAYVPVPPSPAMVGGRRHLVWEVFVANGTAAPVQLTGLTVTDEAGEIVAQVDEAGLQSQFRALRQEPPTAGRIDPGHTGVVYLWHTLEGPELPQTLHHELTLTGAQGAETRTLSVPVSSDAPVVLGPPVLGQGWFAANSPANESPHRRSVQVLDEGLFTAQRYAVDLVRVTDAGTFAGDPLDNASYYAYGAELLAVADGTVVAVRDGIPENVPGSDSRAVEITYDTLAGNAVLLDIGSQRYVAYAHLQPGSLRVAVGDTVTAGDVLGLVGNSGNSSEPHLHLHVCDAPSILACHGRPWGFASFVQVALTETAPGEFSAGAPRMVQREMPIERGYLIFTPP